MPDAALRILSWYATKGDGASTFDPGANRKNAEIVATRGLNSVRGSAARAIGRLVDGNREHIPALEPAIRSLVTDPEPPVRALAIEIPLWMLRHDEDLALELFEEGVADAEEDVLDSRGVSEFLRYRGRRYFDRLLSLIERMLASKSEDVQRNGAVQATLIALGEPDARELVERCLDGPTAQRRGVARVCAANVADPSHREYCEGLLIALFDDPDEDVRNDAVVAIREMRKGGAERSTRLIERLLASRAFGDDLRAPVMAIKEADAPPPQLALEVAEKTLERLGAPGDIAGREAMVAATSSTSSSASSSIPATAEPKTPPSISSTRRSAQMPTVRGARWRRSIGDDEELVDNLDQAVFLAARVPNGYQFERK